MSQRSRDWNITPRSWQRQKWREGGFVNFASLMWGVLLGGVGAVGGVMVEGAGPGMGAILGVGAGLMCGMLGAIWGHRIARKTTVRITRTQHELTHAAHQLSQGEHVPIPGVEQTDEWGVLARALKQMELDRANQSLKLRTLQERYDSLFDSNPCAILELDTQGRVSEANPMAAKLTGYSVEELRGMGCQAICPAGEWPQIEKHIAETLTKGEAHFECRLRDKQEQPHEVAVGMSQIRTEGKVVGLHVVLVDITQRRKAELALQHREWEFKTLAENTPDVLARFDAAGRCVYINRAVQLYRGRPPEAYIGKTLGEMGVDTLARETWQRNLQEVMADGAPRIFAYTHRTDRGRWHVQAHLVPEFTWGGKVGSILAVVRDVTAEQAALEALQQKGQVAEAANHAKDQFLAMLSHELRTPLTPALGIIEALEASPHFPSSMREDVDLLRRNLLLQTRLIDDLLDLTRISKGKLTLQTRHVDAHLILKDTVSTCQPDILAKGLSFSTDLRATRTVLRADPGRLHQIVWNLLKNAVKFTPAGGEIRLRTSQVYHKPKANGNGNGANHGEAMSLVIEVEDTGIGIDAEMLPHIFKAFQQGSTAVTREFGGLGLGLAISRALVEMHGGRLEAHSQGRGRGACFRAILPVAREGVTVTTEPASIMPVPNGKATRTARILLVDDHLDTAQVLSRLLRSVGHQITVAHSMQRALGAVEKETFDLVISDIGLPDGSGLELMQTLRQRRPMRGIALSGFGMEEDIRKSLGVGFEAHLVKPVDSGKLLALVGKMTEGSG